MVLVPDDNHPMDAFFAGDLIPIENSPLKILSGRLVLSAAGETRRGWHLKLMSEMCYYLQRRDVQIVFSNTQSTNRAVIHNFEKLGWKYGKSTHIFSVHGYKECNDAH